MINTDSDWGLSIVVCCHNSAKRLPTTLEHLAQLELGEPWEVLIINNASTDDTAAVAQGFADRLPLRVVDEPEPGLTYARHRGLAESRFAILGFIDDDNHVPPHWAAAMLAIFKDQPQVAACGGPISEICEMTPPPWFEKFKGNYTIWAPHEQAQAVRHPLCGAGLGIRKTAWEKLRADGFESLLSDRKGAALSSGGDFELGYALLLAGWQLYYDPALHLRHFIPAGRLNWNYLCRLNEGFGRQSVVLDAYAAAVEGKPAPGWAASWLRGLWSLLRQLPAGLAKREGDSGLLLWLSQKGRLSELWQKRSSYRAMLARINSISAPAS